ncbi:alkylphosphocholine resistance protein lem3 [Taxawa tesnikishii (nom. ined.)]|nr:alkylphosphocholine resistance protein lem3 [Dothideales sp. JES 119]
MSQTQIENADSIREEEVEDNKKKQKSRRPANTAFRQQRLKAWQPILTPKTVLPLFFAVGIIFAPIGGLLLWASAQVQELSIDYQDCATRAPEWPTFSSVPSSHFSTSFKNATPAAEVPSWSRNTTLVHYGNGGDYTVNTTVCMLQFYVPDVIGPPVLFYYRLTNFYQNHRRYVKSYDQDQLSGKFRSNTSIHESDCDPLRTDDATGKAYYPCGLIANSVFNDTFFSPVLLNTPGSNAGNTTYQMSNKGIAWDSDKDLYKTTAYTVDQVVPPPNWRVRYPTYNETFPLPDLHDDEAFQVWMRTAGLPSFSKLALRNDDTAMAVGRYQVDIHDYFPTTIYDGTKSILISTRTVMGGKNPFLGIAYIVVAGICILLGALFTATHLIRPRKLGDHTYLSWNNDQSSSATATGRASRPGDTA